MFNNRILCGIASVALAVAALLFQAGCTRDNSPGGDYKRRIQDYISKSFAARGASDRGELLRYLTGDAKRRLGAWSDEQFQQAFVDSKRQFVKLAFREVKQPTPKEVSVTYELTYIDQRHDARVTNKKLAQLVLENGEWLIADVKNIKELVEYRNEMSLP